MPERKRVEITLRKDFIDLLKSKARREHKKLGTVMEEILELGLVKDILSV